MNSGKTLFSPIHGLIAVDDGFRHHRRACRRPPGSMPNYVEYFLAMDFAKLTDLSGKPA